MTEKEIRNMKINRVTFWIIGVLFAFMGVAFIPFLLVGIVLMYLGYKTNKEYKKAIKKEQIKQPEPVTKMEPVRKPEIKEAADEPVKAEEIPPEQYEKMRLMCIDLHKEYKALLKEYKDSDESGKVYILKECYRKLNVLDSTVGKYKCYYEIDTYEEVEKIEKKAKSFINAYIKEQREGGNDDYMIDVIQFSDDLEFISDYIYEKDEKLNRM